VQQAEALEMEWMVIPGSMDFHNSHRKQHPRCLNNHSSNMKDQFQLVGSPHLEPVRQVLSNRDHNSHKKMNPLHFDDYNSGM
jgi:hypothetical protein